MKTFLKKIYGLLPFKQQFFQFLKLFWKPEEKIYRHLHFTGIITVPIDDSRSFKIHHYGYQVENDLFWSGLEGEWEKHSLLIWKKLAAKADVIFDIGANTGVYSLLAKAVNRNAVVYAFEPVERVFEKLKRNMQLNQFDVHCIQKALSDTTGVAVLYDDDSDHEYAASLHHREANDTSLKTSEVPTITLDDFIEESGLPKIDLMKIDVEHHEPEVLAGFKNYLQRYQPVMLIEVLADETGAAIQKIVEGMNYRYFAIDEKAGAKRVAEIKKTAGMNYLLCPEKTANALEIT